MHVCALEECVYKTAFELSLKAWEEELNLREEAQFTEKKILLDRRQNFLITAWLWHSHQNSSDILKSLVCAFMPTHVSCVCAIILAHMYLVCVYSYLCTCVFVCIQPCTHVSCVCALKPTCMCFVCMDSYLCTCVLCVCAFMPVHMYIWEPEVGIGCLPCLFSIIFFDTGSLQEVGAYHISGINWLSSNSRLQPLSLPSIEIINLNCCAQLLHRC